MNRFIISDRARTHNYVVESVYALGSDSLLEPKGATRQIKALRASTLRPSKRPFNQRRSTGFTFRPFASRRSIFSVRGESDEKGPKTRRELRGMSFCTKCGQSVAGRTNFCGSCGSPLFSAQTQPMSEEVGAPRTVTPTVSSARRVSVERPQIVVMGGVKSGGLAVQNELVGFERGQCRDDALIPAADVIAVPRVEAGRTAVTNREHSKAVVLYLEEPSSPSNGDGIASRSVAGTDAARAPYLFV
jgi:hypothetical protein